MHKKMRILSFHHIPNNGAFLFSCSLLKLLQKEFKDFDVQILDYKSPQLVVHEYLKRFKIFQRIPLFYMKRARLWNKQLKKNLELDRGFPHFISEKSLQKYFRKNYDALVVGMDVWCIINSADRPGFPNIYWLPEKSAIPKIAYSVSAYHSDQRLIQSLTKKIGEYLDGFDVIGARDRYTYQLIQEHRNRRDGLVEMLPDPTFTYEFRNTDVKTKLEMIGVDLTRPILGLLFFGNNKFSGEILSHYKAKGYQIVAMSMYNAAADFNAGHLLTPFEWAEAFRYFSFCISDRFHGALFCLKNKTPFISLEKDVHLPREQSKMYDLLAGFNLEICYQNPTDAKFESSRFFAHANEIEDAWERDFKSAIQPKIDIRKQDLIKFICKMKNVL